MESNPVEYVIVLIARYVWCRIRCTRYYLTQTHHSLISASLVDKLFTEQNKQVLGLIQLKQTPYS